MKPAKGHSVFRYTCVPQSAGYIPCELFYKLKKGYTLISGLSRYYSTEEEAISDYEEVVKENIKVNLEIKIEREKC